MSAEEAFQHCVEDQEGSRTPLMWWCSSLSGSLHAQSLRCPAGSPWATEALHGRVGGSACSWPTGWRQLSITGTCHSQGGENNNLAATSVILLWKTTVYNTMLSHKHSLYIRVISASWRSTTTGFFHSVFFLVVPEQPAPWWAVSRMLIIVKHDQLSHLLNPNIFASGLQSNSHAQVTLRAEMTHSTLSLVITCEKEKRQLELQTPVWDCRDGEWNTLLVTGARLLWKLLNDVKPKCCVPHSYRGSSQCVWTS